MPRPTVIVLASQKGGVGKTALSAHLAVAAEMTGAGPVVLYDTDPQQSLAEWWRTGREHTSAREGRDSRIAGHAGPSRRCRRTAGHHRHAAGPDIRKTGDFSSHRGCDGPVEVRAAGWRHLSSHAVQDRFQRQPDGSRDRAEKQGSGRGSTALGLPRPDYRAD